MDQFEIAQILREIGILLELTDENPKKGIAYKRAAHSLENSNNFQYLVENNGFETLPGIGKTISSMIIRLIKNGSLEYYEQLKDCLPSTILELINIPSLTPQKIKILYNELKIASINDLKTALENQRLNGIKGFGPAFTAKLQKKLNKILNEGHSLLYPRALILGEALKAALKGLIIHIDTTGSLRRKCEVVDQLNLLALSENASQSIDRFINHKFVRTVLSKNENEATVLLKQGIPASLKIVQKEAYPFCLLQETGNETHVKKITEKLNQKRLLKKHSSIFSSSNEEDIYKALGRHFIPPELREDYGEIEAALRSDFSDLIEENDLKGAFHCHTVASDGNNTIEEMSDAAIERGWEYIGITDHSKSSYQANGLSDERLQEQINAIKKLNHTYLKKGFKIFSGVECDILKDGLLDVDESILKQLDFVIISAHSLFKQEKDIMTKRFIKAIENPYSTIVGHLTGRLLNHRDPYQVDVLKIIDACLANDKIIEINSSPSRLDMDWRYWAQAKDKGLKCSINPDAHSTYELENCRYGVNIARKGWVTKENVINTLTLKKMSSFLLKRKPS